MGKKENALSEKSMKFAVRIVKFYQYLQVEKKEYILSKQVLRSGTSIGANVRESRNAQSDADFLNRLNIALKEADETQYWLELLRLTGIVSEESFLSMNSDVDELVSMLVSAIKTMKNKMSK